MVELESGGSVAGRLTTHVGFEMDTGGYRAVSRR